MKAARIVAAASIAAFLVAGTACSSSSKKSGATDSSSGSASSTTAAASRPPGPAATLAELTGGKGINLASPTGGKGVDLASPTAANPTPIESLSDTEYSASGTATSYKAKGPLSTDGRFDLQPSGSAPYTTRIVVRRPKKPADFNGTVVVEWLNVSGGVDASPDFTYLAGELVPEGYAWVGVSAQYIGVEGGAIAVGVPGAAEAGAGKGIKKLDPARYGKLHHPGDAYSYDIYTQVARALRQPGRVDALGGLKPKHVLAAGESQSAFMLTTYVDGVQPLTHEFDGFFVHSRGGPPGQLGDPGKGTDIAAALSAKPAKIRTDLDVPVMIFETESDVVGILNYLPAAQPDTDHIRLWEVAGTAHADHYLIGNLGDQVGCPTKINDGPQHFVAETAFHDLDTWVAKGVAPPKAPRFEVDAAGKYVRDADGIVKGGIRTPLVDVPVDVLSGTAPQGGSIVCLLLGSTIPLPAARLQARYPSRQAYLDEFSKAADAAIKAGFVLPRLRTELLKTAQPDRIGS